jgi:FMN phosphatase YigB (HAD superfamily)
MVKAVIFDCFGVLATEAWLPFKAKHFVDSEQFEEAGDLMKQANSGLISQQDFIDKIAALAGISQAEVLHAIRQNVPNGPLFNYMRDELKPKYKIGFLSNVADDYMRQIFKPEQLALFDAIVLSYKTGFIKPEPEAYQIVADRLDVDSSECVLVDDKERNVTGARQAGMQAILYKDLDQLKQYLAKLADPKS